MSVETNRRCLAIAASDRRGQSMVPPSHFVQINLIRHRVHGTDLLASWKSAGLHCVVMSGTVTNDAENYSAETLAKSG